MPTNLDASPSAGGADSARSDSETLSVNQAAYLVSTNFGHLDTDGDKFLTSDELKSASTSVAQLSARDQLAIEAFASTAERIQKLNNDEYFTENSGISQQDLMVLRGESSEHPELIADIDAALPGRDLHDKRVFGSKLENAFDKMDFDKDGFVTIPEVEHFRDNEQNSAEEREVARVVAENYDGFKTIVSEYGFGSEQSYYGGPFKTGGGSPHLTKRDVSAFSNYLARPENFESYLKSMRTEELVGGIAGGTVMSVASGVTGVAAFLMPEPLMKVGLGTASVAAGLSVLMCVDDVMNGHSDEVREQYKKRQEMLDSWKYFNK